MTEEFYENFWKSGSWGEKEMNKDEQARHRVITGLMDAFVMPRLKYRHPIRIVDVGCGRGWLTNQLNAYGSVLGIDPTAAAIKRAKELFPDEEFLCEDAIGLLDRLKIPAFHLAVSSEVIEHVPDAGKRDFLESLRDLLVPDGFAILTTPRGELWKQWLRLNLEQQPVEAWVSERELGQLCRAVGFTVIARGRVFLPNFGFNWLSRLLISKRFSRLQKVSALRRACGFYQVVLLQKKDSHAG